MSKVPLVSDDVADLPIADDLRRRIGERVEIALPARIVGVGTKGVTLEVHQTFGDKYLFTARDFRVLTAPAEKDR